MVDVGLEVACESLGVTEVETSLEVKAKQLVVDIDLAVEAVVSEIAVQGDAVDVVAKQLDIVHIAVDVEIHAAFVIHTHDDIGIQVEGANHFLGVDEGAYIEAVGYQVTFKDVVMLVVLMSVERHIHVADLRSHCQVGLELVQGAVEVAFNSASAQRGQHFR